MLHKAFGTTNVAQNTDAYNLRIISTEILLRLK